MVNYLHLELEIYGHPLYIYKNIQLEEFDGKKAIH